MMHHLKKYLLILFLVSGQIVNGNQQFKQENCHWIDSNGNEYDLSSLKKPNGWKIKDSNDDSGVFSMDYLFQFCGDMEKKCKNQQVGAFEALEVMGQLTDTCEILGRFSQQQITTVENGVKITYKHGDVCTNSENPADNNQPRKINFVVQCATPSQDETWVKSKINSDTVTKCNLEFSMKSLAGCKIGGSFVDSVKSLVFYILLILLIYFAIGIFYNMKYKNQQGVQAIPNLEFWEQVPGYIIAGTKISAQKSQEFILFIYHKVKGTQQNQSGGYYGSSSGGGFGTGGYNVV